MHTRVSRTTVVGMRWCATLCWAGCCIWSWIVCVCARHASPSLSPGSRPQRGRAGWFMVLLERHVTTSLTWKASPAPLSYSKPAAEVYCTTCSALRHVRGHSLQHVCAPSPHHHDTSTLIHTHTHPSASNVCRVHTRQPLHACVCSPLRRACGCACGM